MSTWFLMILAASSFTFQPIEPERAGVISKWDVPLGRWCEVRFEQGQSRTLGAFLMRSGRDAAMDRRRALAREAYLRAASHSGLSFKAAAGTLAMVAGHVMHPIDAALLWFGLLLVWWVRRRRPVPCPSPAVGAPA